MASLLECTFVEILTLSDEPYLTGLQRPLLVIVIQRPQVPIGVENVGIVVVQQVGGDLGGLLGPEARAEFSFQNGGLAPGDGMQRQIANAELLLRKRKLPQYGDCAGHDIVLAKTGEPETEV